MSHCLQLRRERSGCACSVRGRARRYSSLALITSAFCEKSKSLQRQVKVGLINVCQAPANLLAVLHEGCLSGVEARSAPDRFWGCKSSSRAALDRAGKLLPA